MGLNTYPSNPFPPSTDRMDADALETEVSKLNNDVSELKSGLTNVQGDVKLNTQDLTTPSRSKNVINILDKASETINGVTAVCSGGVITLTGESSGDAEFYFSLVTPLVLDPTLYKIAFNNTATNQYMAIRFRNSSTTLLSWAPNVENRIVENWQDSVTCDRLSIAIPNGYFTEMSISITVLDKTETDTTYAPYIPSVESRIEAVESGLANKANTLNSLSINPATQSVSGFLDELLSTIQGLIKTNDSCYTMAGMWVDTAPFNGIVSRHNTAYNIYVELTDGVYLVYVSGSTVIKKQVTTTALT